MTPQPPAGGAELAALIAVAEWAIFLGPAVLTYLWVFGGGADRRSAVGAGLAALAGLALSGAISAVWYVPRPFADGSIANVLGHAADGSFPSDHATFLFCLAFALWFSPPPKWPRASWAMAACALAVGFARVRLGVHHPADIAGAALIGLGCGALSCRGLTLWLGDALTAWGGRAYAATLALVGLGRWS